MVNAKMRNYDYYLYGEDNGYGQAQLTEEPVGTIKMAVYVINKAVHDMIHYTKEDYIGLTNDKDIDNRYVIQYGTERLKVLYTVKCEGHKTQVFMARM